VSALRVALVHHAYPSESDVGVLARALAAAGHEPSVVAAGLARPADHQVRVVRVPHLPDAVLRVRKIGENLSHVPAAAVALRAASVCWT
jgi:hypothetical protein